MDISLLLIVLMAFAAVTGVAFVGGQYYLARQQLRRRLPAGNLAADVETSPASGRFGSLIAEHFTENRFGVDSKLRQKLRRELLRAGYFSNDAVRYYVFARFCTVIVLPCAVFILTRLFVPHISNLLFIVMVSVAAGLGILAPDYFLSRRQGGLQAEYRQIFPDLLDLLIVCVGAGLSVDAALERIRGHLSKRSPALGLNLELMAAEMRAGRSSVEALNSLADRLGLDEASSFVAVLRHSAELGGDVADSLRVFSDEMRDKRMLRAEEAANKLPVKIVMPLAAGIFPVIMMIAMLPVFLKLAAMFHK